MSERQNERERKEGERKGKRKRGLVGAGRRPFRLGYLSLLKPDVLSKIQKETDSSI